jgi:5-methylcytosine-specific restriction endonuclease McrA
MRSPSKRDCVGIVTITARNTLGAGMKRNVLLLNADWTPLNFVSSMRALNLLFKGRAEVITVGEHPSAWDDIYTTPGNAYRVPATVRLLDRVTRKYSTPRFRKRVLFNRDNWQCQYCGINLDYKTITIDHVHPRSKGGGTDWKNCVSACKKCNLRKGSRLLPETGMNLRKVPSVPLMTHFWDVSPNGTWHPDWASFFQFDSYRA